jgi:hypothetical protein
LENDADPARRRLAERVNEELRRIAGDLWRPHETEPDVILVAYVGPASFV